MSLGIFKTIEHIELAWESFCGLSFTGKCYSKSYLTTLGKILKVENKENQISKHIIFLAAEHKFDHGGGAYVDGWYKKWVVNTTNRKEIYLITGKRESFLIWLILLIQILIPDMDNRHQDVSNKNFR